MPLFSLPPDGDLVVATGAKSGTTFMLYCTHQIRTKGKDINDELFPDVSIATPWPDLIQSRGGSWAEQKERYNTTIIPDGRTMKEVWDHPSYPFRIFKSHFGPPDLPVRKKGGKKIKYMAMVRNGLDVAASMTDFYSAHTDEFRHLWGGEFAVCMSWMEYYIELQFVIGKARNAHLPTLRNSCITNAMESRTMSKVSHRMSRPMSEMRMDFTRR